MAFEAVELLKEDQELLANLELLIKTDQRDAHTVRTVDSILRSAFKHFALADHGGMGHKAVMLREIQSGLRDLNDGIGALFSSPKTAGMLTRTPEHRMFDDAFKGLLNAGKMLGAGLKNENIDKIMKRNIQYNGVTTTFGEVLKNINWSQEQLDILDRSKGSKNAEVTDFSGLDLEDITDTLTDIWVGALPPQLKTEEMHDVRWHLADKMLSGARLAGHLENMLEDERRKNKHNGGYEKLHSGGSY
jgi:hypothetical protein